MADRYQYFEFTYPAQNGAAVPVTNDTSFPQGVVQQVDITIPYGADGLIGFQVLSGKSSVIPYNSPLFLLRPGGTWSFPVSNQPASGSWQFSAYNADYLPHTVQVLFYINESGPTVSAPPSTLPVMT